MGDEELGAFMENIFKMTKSKKAKPDQRRFSGVKKPRQRKRKA